MQTYMLDDAYGAVEAFGLGVVMNNDREKLRVRKILAGKIILRWLLIMIAIYLVVRLAMGLF